jgi:hypothetical protein
MKKLAAVSHNEKKFVTFNDGWATNAARPASVDYAFDTLLPSMFPNPSQYEIGSVPW